MAPREDEQTKALQRADSFSSCSDALTIMLKVADPSVVGKGQREFAWHIGLCQFPAHGELVAPRKVGRHGSAPCQQQIADIGFEHCHRIEDWSTRVAARGVIPGEPQMRG